MSKDKKPLEQEQVSETPVVTVANKYRYWCEGCTGDAMLFSNKPVGIKIVCQKCGKQQVTEEKNFLEIK